VSVALIRAGRSLDQGMSESLVASAVYGPAGDPECTANSCDCCERCRECGRRTRGEFRPFGMCRNCVMEEAADDEYQEQFLYPYDER
jgi:hypothetical protein